MEQERLERERLQRCREQKRAIGLFTTKDRATVCVILPDPTPAPGGSLFHYELPKFSLALFRHIFSRLGDCSILILEMENLKAPIKRKADGTSVVTLPGAPAN